MKPIYKILTAIVLLASPITSFSLSLDNERHLWGRTGFGDISSYNQSVHGLSRAQAVNMILAQPKSSVRRISFDERDYLLQKKRTKKEKRQFRKQVIDKDQKRLLKWWYKQIINTENPLEEKMTIFWHRHFTSDLKKASPPIMHSQNQLFREHALGNFADLLKETMRNPAIHLYLDNQKSTSKKPNENLARELLELFTMGEGSGYTENDIKEIARAITGYRVKRSFTTMTMIQKRHDSGRKTIFGQSGWYGLNSVIDLILQQPQTAKHITSKILKDFLTENPTPQQIEHYSSIFRTSGYEIKPLLKAIFNSDDFWDTKNNLVKSPYDMFKSAFSLLPSETANNKRVLMSISKSGQKLFYPPDVKGWRTGQSWLSSDLILERMRMINIISKPLKGETLSAKAINYAIGEPDFRPNSKKWAIRSVLKQDNFNFK